MAVMTAATFIQKLKNIVNRRNYYYNQFPYNLGYYNGNAISFDCWNLVKALINEPGIDQNYTVGHHAPAVGNMGDIDGWTMLMNCSGRSQDFSNLTPGEFLYMSGHAGVYIGNWQVVECTCDWEGGVLISGITNKGGRYRNGIFGRSWEWHGKLNWIDYSGQPKPEPGSKMVSCCAYDIDQREWLPIVTSGSYAVDTIGNPSHMIGGVAVHCADQNIRYAVHENGGKWLPEVNGYNVLDFKNGFAGNLNRSIDCLIIFGKGIKYQAKVKRTQVWLPPVQSDYAKYNDVANGFAGNPGWDIDEIRIWRV